MTEIRRMCLACAGQLQEAGIPCEMTSSAGGVRGICPACQKRTLCYNWKIRKNGGRFVKRPYEGE